MQENTVEKWIATGKELYINGSEHIKDQIFAFIFPEYKSRDYINQSVKAVNFTFPQTKNTYLRLIEEDDVDFLLSLRLNKNLNMHLNKVEDDKQQQITWIKNYKNRESVGEDFYFVIVDKKQGEIGLVRVYDIDNTSKSFTWGSWIIKEENRPKTAAIESALLVYEFAFNDLGLLIAKFDVRNDNVGVINFHNRFGAIYLNSDNINNYFELPKTKYIQLKYSKYYNFLLN